jgi:hypothetical protein
MIDLSDVTFTIPFKLDTPERLRNVNIIIDFLNKNFTTNILLCENSNEQKFGKNGKYEYN